MKASEDPLDAGMAPDESAYIGVDGTRGRWISIGLGAEGAFLSARLTDTLAEILEAFPRARAIVSPGLLRLVRPIPVC